MIKGALYSVYANKDGRWLDIHWHTAACEEFRVNPKITLIIVGKRHHIQYVEEDDS